MKPFQALFRVDWSSRRLRILDLGLAAGTLLYGLLTGHDLLVWVGVVAVLLALLNPMGRLQRWLRGFVRAPGARR